MATQVFINLPVKDLNKTKEFFSKLGYTFNAQFTDEKAACMIVDENIFVMLLTEPFFKTFIKKDICDATKSTEVITALSVASKERVDEMVNIAVQNGGTATTKNDHGWMYQWGYEDLDGHLWEVMYADMSQLSQHMPNP